MNLDDLDDRLALIRALQFTAGARLYDLCAEFGFERGDALELANRCHRLAQEAKA